MIETPENQNSSRRVVSYSIVFGPQESSNFDDPFSLDNQRKELAKFSQGNDYEVIASYDEPYEKKRKQYPNLLKAIEQCQQRSAELIITKLHNLTRISEFTTPLLESGIKFICLDQPKITRETLPAIIEHHGLMSSMHSARIRLGLSQTQKALGNPHAKQEITKVNKPKTENAIMFAVILAPIVDLYRRQGFSQRKMVEALNDDGFLAPEGGQWVLSQLQKVLDRIDLNNISLNLSSSFDEFDQKGYNLEQQARALNAMGACSPGRGEWTDEKITKTRARRDEIRDIMNFNNFITEVYPQMQSLADDGLNDSQIANIFNEDGISIPNRVLWEIEQDQLEIPEDKALKWEAHDVDLFRVIAKRRADEMEHFIHPQTYGTAMGILDERFGDSESSES